MLDWEKDMSTTEAQQETRGAIVPYLRLTQGSLKDEDFRTWFRDVFFREESWGVCKVGRTEDCECAIVNIKYILVGNDLGRINTKISHCPSRQESNNAPTTWLHWPSEIESFLQQNDTTGKKVSLKNDNGKYTLEIQ